MSHVVQCDVCGRTFEQETVHFVVEPQGRDAATTLGKDMDVCGGECLTTYAVMAGSRNRDAAFKTRAGEMLARAAFRLELGPQLQAAIDKLTPPPPPAPAPPEEKPVARAKKAQG